MCSFARGRMGILDPSDLARPEACMEYNYVVRLHRRRRAFQALEEVKLREVQIVEMQKKVTDGESRLRQQQALYEAVRADRNSYSKNLIEAQVGGCNHVVGHLSCQTFCQSQWLQGLHTATSLQLSTGL